MITRNSLLRVAASFVAAVAFSSVFASQAQTLLQRTAFLITSPNVALDLKLSKAQVAKRGEIMTTFDSSRGEIVKRMEAAKPEQYDSFRAELDQLESQTTSKLVGLLDAVQVRRLRQIGIQGEGTEALQDASVATDLGLTAAQRQKMSVVFEAVQKAQDDYQAALGEQLSKIPEPGSDPAAIKAYSAKQQEVIRSMKPSERVYLLAKEAGDKKLLAIMTPVQRKKWAAMRGKPLKPG